MKTIKQKHSSKNINISYLSDHSSEDDVIYGDPSVTFDFNREAYKNALKNLNCPTPETPEDVYRVKDRDPLIPRYDYPKFQISANKADRRLDLLEESPLSMVDSPADKCSFIIFKLLIFIILRIRCISDS